VAANVRPQYTRAMGAIVAIVLVAGAVAAVRSPSAGAVQFPQNKLVSARPASWTPWVDNGAVRAIAQVGSKIYVGGSFTSVRQAGASTALAQPYLFAFNATTGAIDTSFRPKLNAAVNALAPAPGGNGIIAGGRFGTVNGQSRGKLVMLNLTGGTVSSFAATVTGGNVIDLVVRNGVAYLGGGFTTVNGTTQRVLAAVDATTGALVTRLRPTITGTWNGGTTHVQALDVTPSGSRLVIAGNFTSIDGQDRVQLAQFDLTTTPNQLANWATDALEPACSSSFDSIPNDVDYSPDGSYFAMVTTGAFAGGVNAGVLCDTTTRWETNATGTGVEPTWIDYAGGDTQVGVAVTATAIYTSGHMRWQNDPYRGDAAGPGSVSRQGLSALDPLNGLPFSWNPTRSISGGSWDTTFLATSTGLWLGFDRDIVGRQTHKRLAFFPLDGGKVVPSSPAATLPGRLYSLPDDGCPAVDPSVLIRVNAGGPTLGSRDCGPDWVADDGAGTPGEAFHTVGSNTASWANAVTIPYEPGGPVPTSAPAALFDTERWDPDGNPEMSWTFPVAAGTPIQVRLYFIDQCDCTGPGGTPRAFDVRLENQLVLDDYNIVADVGHRVATVKRFNITSDGSVGIEFRHVSENPLINAIEIVRTDVAPTQPQARTFLTWRTFDGSTAGPAQQLATPNADWSTARGAFLIGGTLYYGQTDGNLYTRPFSQAGVGSATSRFPYVVGPGPVFANVTGMFFTNGRIYYTSAGDATMHYRYFTPESGVVGAVEFDVPSNGFAWSLARGVTLANGRIYWSTPDGSLHRATFTNGEPSGTDQIVSGPAVDGQTWDGYGMFVAPA